MASTELVGGFDGVVGGVDGVVGGVDGVVGGVDGLVRQRRRTGRGVDGLSGSVDGLTGVDGLSGSVDGLLGVDGLSGSVDGLLGERPTGEPHADMKAVVATTIEITRRNRIGIRLTPLQEVLLKQIAGHDQAITRPHRSRRRANHLAEEVRRDHRVTPDGNCHRREKSGQEQICATLSARTERRYLAKSWGVAALAKFGMMLGGSEETHADVH